MKKILFISIIAISLFSCKKDDDSDNSSNTTSTLGNGLVAYYPFNGNANDVSGHNYNGIVNGATLTTDRFGNTNKAYYFNGVNNYIDLSDFVSDFNISAPVSLSFWVNSTLDDQQAVFSVSATQIQYTSPYSSLIAIGNNCTNSLNNELLIAGNQSSTSNYYITGFTTTDRTLLLDSTWHHVVYVFDTISTKIYLDNVLLGLSCNYGTNNGSYGNIPSGAITVIGTRYAVGGFGSYFKGSLDDFRFYNRVLTSSEISQLFHTSN